MTAWWFSPTCLFQTFVCHWGPIIITTVGKKRNTVLRLQAQNKAEIDMEKPAIFGHLVRNAAVELCGTSVKKKKTVMKETLMRTCENVQSQKCMLNHFMNHWVIWSWIFLGISPYTFLVALATISTGRFAPSSCPNVDRQCPGCRWWPRAQLATCSVRMSHEDITSQSMCANHQLRRTLLLKIED